MGTTARLSRYKDVAKLLIKHGDIALDDSAQLGEHVFAELDETDFDEGGPASLADDLEALGPTFVKLGQLLSSRPDLIPAEYARALERLHDAVAPIPAEEAKQVIEDELGVSVDRAFSEFDPQPLAAASLAQVHRARLRDGRDVVVKVQRPGIRDTIRDDLDALERVAEVFERHSEAGRKLSVTEMVEEFREALVHELDFAREGRNLTEFRENLRDHDAIVIPQPIEDYTKSRVLTMTRIPGASVDQLNPVAFTELDRDGLGSALLRCYLDQILIYGAFHADPHPGNVLITPEGRLALIDLGMVARVDPQTRDHYMTLLLALSDGRGREAAELARELASRDPGADPEAFDREVADLVQTYYRESVADAATGRVLLEVVRLAIDHGFRPPASMSMLGKTLMHLDQIVKIVSPELRANAVIQEHAESLIQRNLAQSLSPGRIFTSALEMNDFTQRLPGRVNRLLDQLVEGELQVRVDAVDEVALTGSLRSIANRITLGLVLASLIVGAALLMRIETQFTLFGYPGLAILVFLLAAGLGLGLVITIARRDYWSGPAS